jgi:hypothetical protein
MKKYYELQNTQTIKKTEKTGKVINELVVNRPGNFGKDAFGDGEH